MKIKSDLTWALLLLITAAISFYLGTRTGTLETEQNLESRIQDSREKIIVLENKIEQLSEELRSRGIFSYPQANVIFEKGDPEAKVLIMLNGKEAIPNLEIERKVITDPSAKTGEKPQEVKTSHVGTLSAHNPLAFDVKEFEKEMTMHLKFKSDRDLWYQYIRARKTPQGEIKTFWIITNQDSEVIDKHIDEGFPTDEDGNVVLGQDSKIKYSDIRMNSVYHPSSEDEKKN